ncbi:MAG: hypothetical protein HY650_00870 [Acidobacteria bacterium]|nr:hypothetical protein [Acidobacteriota bacterium]
MECPRLDQLYYYQANKLDPELAAELRVHISAPCDDCHENIAWLARLSNLLSTDDAPHLPEWLTRTAVAMYDRLPSEEPSGGLGRLIARLAFDNAAQPQMAGARESRSAPHQLVFKAGGYDIDLAIEGSPPGSRCDLTGQILGLGQEFLDVGEARVALCQRGQMILEIRSNGFGEFRFTGVAEGEYDLRIRPRGHEVWIMDLRIAEA